MTVLVRSVAVLSLAIVMVPPAPAQGPPTVPPAASNCRTLQPGPARDRCFAKGKWKLAAAERVTDLRSFDVDAGAAIVAKAASQHAADPVAAAKEVFSQLNFHEVKTLIDAGRLPPAVSKLLGDGRVAMMAQAIEATLQAEGKTGSFTVGVLDSGNKDSGIGSDIDQTLILLPTDPTKPVGMDVADFIHRLEANFRRLHGFPPLRMEIESIDGRDFFPDWRAEHQTLKAFEMEARRVVLAKTPNNALYRSEAELKINAEGRGVAALKKHFAALEQLQRQREALADADLPEAERAARRAQIDADLAKLLAKSPWIEFRVNPQTGTVVTDLETDPRQRGFLPNDPEIVRRFAFDGVYDNWLMFESHPDNQAKYLLRATADGVGLLTSLRLESGRYDLDKPWQARTFEYEKAVELGEPAQELRRQFIKDIYGGLDAGGSALNTARIERALDAAARARLRHKGATGFANLTTAQIYAEYFPEKLHPERAAEWLKLPLASRLEAAQLAWRVDAREIMVENLIRTVNAPADVLQGNLDRAEWKEILKKYPAANPTKLRRAAWLQLFHGFRDLLSVEHAREILADLEQGRRPFDVDVTLRTRSRMTDLVDRLVEKLGATDRAGRRELMAEVEKVLIDAAGARMKLHPVPGNPVSEAAREKLTEVWRGWMSELGDWKADFDRIRANLRAGNYREVGRRALENSVNRIASAHADILGTLGFRGEVMVWSDDPAKVPEIVFQARPAQALLDGPRPGAWDVRTAAQNFASLGNVDALLNVLHSYQTGGADAAARTALYELSMNNPVISKLTTVGTALKTGNWSGVFQMGAGMAMPIVGQGYLLANVTTSLVSLVGNTLLEPLRNDRMDLAYQGFLGAENRMRTDQRGQRYDMLARVPIRVIPSTVTGPDGTPVTTYAFAEYSRPEIMQLLVNVARLDGRRFAVSDAEYELGRAAGLFGGGTEFERLKAAATDWIANPRLNFEAKRASLWYHYRDGVLATLRAQDIQDMELLFALRLPSGQVPTIAPFFRRKVEDWAYGRGEFAGMVEGENELILPRLPEELETFFATLANRMAGDFIASYRMVVSNDVQAGDQTVNAAIEGQIVQQLWQAVQQQRQAQGLQSAAMVEDAYGSARDPELADAVSEVLLDRRDAMRVPAPRVKVRPQVLGGDRVAFQLAVVADPREYPGPYRTAVDWNIKESGDESDLSATVTVRAANGQTVGKPVSVPVGTLTFTPDAGVAAAPIPKASVGLCTGSGTGTQAPVSVSGSPVTCGAQEPLLIYDPLVLVFTPARDTTKPFAWRVVKNGNVVGASGVHARGDPKALAAAPAGSPGGFQALLNLWTHGRTDMLRANDDALKPGPGEYAVETCTPVWQPGLLGLEGSWGSCHDPWKEEGRVRVGAVEFHYQGFVAESGLLPLGDNRGLALSVTSRIASVVTLAATAQGVGGEGRAQVILGFPQKLNPQQQVLGDLTASLSVTGPNFPWEAELFAPVPSPGVPPTRALAGGRPHSGGRAYDEGLGALHEPERDPVMLDGRVPREGQFGRLVAGQPVTFHLHFRLADDTIGRPAVPFSRLVRDRSVRWYLPVRVGSVEQGLYGFAVYGTTAGQYTGPSPTAPGAVAALEAPNLVGQPYSRAREVLAAMKLRVAATIGGEARTEAEAHTVMAQRQTGESVALELRGPYMPRRVVPPVIGQTRTQARRSLEAAGFTVAEEIGAAAATREEAYTVHTQVPAGTLEVAPGSTVHLLLRGAWNPPVAVPALEGQSGDSAAARLSGLGLIPARRAGPPAPRRELSGIVLGSDPAPGTPLRRGNAVTLTVYEPFDEAAALLEYCLPIVQGGRDDYARGDYARAVRAFRRAIADGCPDADAIRRGLTRGEAALTRQYDQERRERDCSSILDDGVAARRRGELTIALQRYQELASLDCGSLGFEGIGPAIASVREQIREEGSARGATRDCEYLMEDADRAWRAGDPGAAQGLLQRAIQSGCSDPRIRDALDRLRGGGGGGGVPPGGGLPPSAPDQCEQVILFGIRMRPMDPRAAIDAWSQALQAGCPEPRLSEWLDEARRALTGRGGIPPVPDIPVMPRPPVPDIPVMPPPAPPGPIGGGGTGGAQLLGDVEVDRAYTSVDLWDHSDEDGDIISIFVNGREVLSRHTLGRQRNTIRIQLDPNIVNEIVVFAHNTGRLGPNTAQIAIEGTLRGTLAPWNLPAGGRAVARVVVRR